MTEATQDGFDRGFDRAAVASATPGPAPRSSGPPTVLATLAGLRRDLRPLLSVRGAAGTAMELAWCSAHLAIYPFGLAGERRRQSERYRLADLRPSQRGRLALDVEAAGTPILLVHGMVDNRAVFTMMKRSLRAKGFGRVVTVNYPLTTNDVRQAARDLAGQVEELVAETGYERIHVVGHSLGGLIARYYVQRLGGDERVHTLVTLGTPHAGTLPAHLLPVQLCRELRPGSELYAELDSPAEGCRTRFVSFWSDLDQMVLPHENGRLLHPDLRAQNLPVHGVGHMSLPVDPRVVHTVAQLLGQLGHDGHTVQAGVTSLPHTAPAS